MKLFKLYLILIAFSVTGLYIKGPRTDYSALSKIYEYCSEANGFNTFEDKFSCLEDKGAL